MKEGEIVLLENVRFHPEEEKNDPAFAKELASLARICMFPTRLAPCTAHMPPFPAGVAAYLPAVAGFPDRQRARHHGQKRWKIRSVRLSPSSAARRFPTRSA